MISKEETPRKRLVEISKKLWRIIWKTLCLYSETDGEQRAASFAYYAFFSLFPLVLLFVSIGSFFVNKTEVTGQVIGFLNHYLPIDEDREHAVAMTIRGMSRSGKSVGAFAFLGLAWSSLRFFQALVRGVNRAWGTTEYSWWQLPLRNLFMVGIMASAFLLGIVAPTVMASVERYWWSYGTADRFGLVTTLFWLVRVLLPMLVLFYGISMFYKFAPRRKTTFAEVWLPSFLVALSLQILQRLFVLYARNFAHFNKVYGAFGGAVALLMWIYLSGSIIIIGGCLCAAQGAVNGKKKEALESL